MYFLFSTVMSEYNAKFATPLCLKQCLSLPGKIIYQHNKRLIADFELFSESFLQKKPFFSPTEVKKANTIQSVKLKHNINRPNMFSILLMGGVSNLSDSKTMIPFIRSVSVLCIRASVLVGN